MNTYVITCGFSEQEKNLLTAVLPIEYELKCAEDVTDMIVTSGLCYIVSGENLDENEYRLLRNYCIEVGGYGNEKIFWIGNDPPCELVTVYDSILDFMLDLENALNQAREYYNTQEMYCSEYAVLPARAIADSLEQDVHTAFGRTFAKMSDKRIGKQLRQEWTAVLETSSAPVLAAVYELSQWLKRNNVPYFMGGSVTSGLIPYILGITRTNPLPNEQGGHNLVWQSFCSYGRRPSFVFHLPKSVEQQITRWKEKHWIRQLNPDLDISWRQNIADATNIQFIFDLEVAVEPGTPEVYREDIYHCLVENGFLEKDAFQAMEVINLGGYVPAAIANALTDHRLRRAGLLSRAEMMERRLYMEAKKED